MITPITALILAVAAFVIGAIGSLASLVLGNIRLPVLLLFAPAPVAAGTNITVSGAGAASGAWAHIRGGRFDRTAFLIMAPTSVVGALVGGLVSGFFPADILLLFVVVIVVEQGIELLRSARRGRAPTVSSEQPARKGRWITWLSLVGFLIGLLGGIVGLILGTIRLPAMLRAGIDVRRAVGTNLAVGFVVGIAGFLGHFLAGTIDLVLAVVMIPPAVAGSLIGARVAGAVSELALKRAIGAILIGVGATLLAILLLPPL